MPSVVDAVVASMQVDEIKLRMSAHNAANALTHGFKRQYEAVQWSGGVPGTANAQAPVVRTVSDARPAPLAQTGAPLDLAIEGDGFFEVVRGTDTLLTRRGHFRMDADGRLVNENGWVLQGTAGELRLTDGAPRIDAGGQVLEGDRLVGQVRIVTLPKQASLVPVSGTLYKSDRAQEVDAGQAGGRLRQGFLERSNVDSATEMVRVVETVRHFETGQRALQAMDELNEKLLRSLGNF